MMKTPVAVIARTTAVDPDPRVARVASLLSNIGFQVEILAWDREAQSTPESRPIPGVRITRERYPGAYGSGFKNLPGLMRFNNAIRCLLGGCRPRLVYSCDLDTALPGLAHRSLHPHSRLIYDIFDTFALSRRIGLFKPALLEMEKAVAMRADALVLPDRNRLTALGGPETGLDPIIVPNTPEDVLADLVAGNGPPRREHFSCVGVLHPDRGIRDIVSAGEISNVGLTVAGFGPESDFLHERLGTDFLGRVSHERGILEMYNARAVVALYDPRIPNNRVAAPNKLYEAMMVGTPLITTQGTPIGDFVEDHKIGLTVRFGDVAGLASAMRELSVNGGQVNEFGLRARTIYQESHAWSEISKPLQAVCAAIYSGER